MPLPALQRLIKTLHALQNVERKILVPGIDRWENDVEHSYFLAMTAWYLVDALQLPLNRERILMLALAHDVLKVHAGDTYVYDKNPEVHASKAEREQKAMIKLDQEYPEWPEMRGSMRSYTLRDTPEAKFVAALDKVLPILSLMEDGGRTWKRPDINVSLADLIASKQEKVKIDPVITDLWQQVQKILQEQETEFFPE